MSKCELVVDHEAEPLNEEAFLDAWARLLLAASEPDITVADDQLAA